MLFIGASATKGMPEAVVREEDDSGKVNKLAASKRRVDGIIAFGKATTNREKHPKRCSHYKRHDYSRKRWLGLLCFQLLSSSPTRTSLIPLTLVGYKIIVGAAINMAEMIILCGLKNPNAS